MKRTLVDTGIPWLGEIPDNWSLVPLKGVLQERKENNDPIKTDFILSLGVRYGIVPYSEKEGGGNKAKEDCSQYRLAYPGDIVMNSMNIISGSVAISNYFGCVSPVYYMFYPKDATTADARYFCYVFQSKAFQRSLLGLGNGILMKESSNGVFNTVRMRISVNKLKPLILPVPSYEEQQRIVDFLDEKCRYIDSIIEKSRGTIEEYKKLQQAIITQAVTQGLSEEATMKDSELGWIQQIPSHWETIPSKYLFKESTRWREEDDVMLTSSVKYGIISQEEYKRLENVNLVTATKETEKWKHVDPNDFIISLMSFKSGLEISYVTGCITWHYIVLKAAKEICHEYYKWLFKSEAYITAIRRTCNFIRNGQDLRYSNFTQVPLIVPPIDEQRAIAAYVEKKVKHMDALIAQKELYVQELEAYKFSLIYEYVTGKKEVPACQ